MRIGVIEKGDFSPKAAQILGEIGKVSFLDGESVSKFIRDKEVIFVRLKHMWDQELLDHAPKLKYICTPTTGLNHIDLNVCKDKAIRIVSLKGETEFLTKNIKATPEHTFGLILALFRNYSKAFLSNSNPEWNRDLHKGQEIFEKNIGVIGFGRVGRVVTEYLRAFGATVYFFDENDSINSIIAQKCNSIDDLIEKSDVVILSASYADKNIKMINSRHIDRMKGKCFINTARGELIDEGYLIDKIASGHFAGIALDVIANENRPNRLPDLLALVPSQNLIITPHISGATYESMAKTEDFISTKLLKTISEAE